MHSVVFTGSGKSIKLQYLVKDNAGVPKLGKSQHPKRGQPRDPILTR